MSIESIHKKLSCLAFAPGIQVQEVTKLLETHFTELDQTDGKSLQELKYRLNKLDHGKLSPTDNHLATRTLKIVQKAIITVSSKYELREKLGNGITGDVYLCSDRSSGKSAVCKIVDRESPLAVRADKVIDRELTSLRCLSPHPNIIQLNDIVESEAKDQVGMILEFVPDSMDLYSHLENNGRMSKETALKYFAQLVIAVEHCHQNGIAHRDLKLENILVDSSGSLKLIDFGMSTPPLEKSRQRVSTSCGSPHYASPEVIVGEPYDPMKSDLWGLGVILYAMTTGGLPFDHDNIPKLLNIVISGKYQIPSHVDPDIADLIRKILVVDTSQRISLEGIRKHPVLQGYFAEKESSASSTNHTVSEQKRTP